ncbi:hypothetical protein BC828DRAFT_377385 [Blastocladiella britannica]|nr:hypothetical protein BC828DRAFT_377385 [Blastocladiella britannica]
MHFSLLISLAVIATVVNAGPLQRRATLASSEAASGTAGHTRNTIATGTTSAVVDTAIPTWWWEVVSPAPDQLSPASTQSPAPDSGNVFGQDGWLVTTPAVPGAAAIAGVTPVPTGLIGAPASPGASDLAQATEIAGADGWNTETDPSSWQDIPWNVGPDSGWSTELPPADPSATDVVDAAQGQAAAAGWDTSDVSAGNVDVVPEELTTTIATTIATTATATTTHTAVEMTDTPQETMAPTEVTLQGPIDGLDTLFGPAAGEQGGLPVVIPDIPDPSEVVFSTLLQAAATEVGVFTDGALFATQAAIDIPVATGTPSVPSARPKANKVLFTDDFSNGTFSGANWAAFASCPSPSKSRGVDTTGACISKAPANVYLTRGFAQTFAAVVVAPTGHDSSHRTWTSGVAMAGTHLEQVPLTWSLSATLDPAASNHATQPVFSVRFGSGLVIDAVAGRAVAYSAPLDGATLATALTADAPLPGTFPTQRGTTVTMRGTGEGSFVLVESSVFAFPMVVSLPHGLTVASLVRESKDRLLPVTWYLGVIARTESVGMPWKGPVVASGDQHISPLAFPGYGQTVHHVQFEVNA